MQVSDAVVVTRSAGPWSVSMAFSELTALFGKIEKQLCLDASESEVKMVKYEKDAFRSGHVEVSCLCQ